jgi:hypothetical protein
MKHLSEEQLMLHYYREVDAGAHLSDCAACRDEFERLSRVLNAYLEYEVPERPENYEQLLWQRISPDLRPEPAFKAAWWRQPWALGPVLAGLLAVAFFAGRISTDKKPGPAMAGLINDQGRERILLVALGDHLERSQMVLVEIANTKPGTNTDIRMAQERAQDLVSENRLYRQTASLAGDNEFNSLLDELERVLTDIAHGPSDLSSPELEQIQRRIENRGLIFKIRVVGANLNQAGFQQKGISKL